ncbi:MAG: hypothetical protein R3Y11_07875 [Pseudomonadota bacterium]
MAIPKKIMRKATAAYEDDMTKALSVVMAIKQSRDIFVDALMESGGIPPRLIEQVSKIERWAERCIKCIAKKANFTGARERFFVRKLKALNHSRKVVTGSCAGSTFNWAAWIYALDVLLWDTIALMKPMTAQGCWARLRDAWDTLMEWMLYTVQDERVDGGPYDGLNAEDMGMKLYEHVYMHFCYSKHGVTL